MKEEAELGRAKARYEKVREVPRDKTLSEMDESGIRASDKDMSKSDLMMAGGAGGVITCTWTKTVQIVGMKSMTCDELETCGLKVAGASDKAPQ